MGCLKLTYYNGEGELEKTPGNYKGSYTKKGSKGEVRINLYSFGAQQVGRTYEGADDNTFGYNDKVRDDEVYDIGGSLYNYGERMYNALLVRFPSPDPLIVKQQQYAWLSPYQYASNSPIKYVDLDGLERAYKTPSGNIVYASDQLRHTPPKDANYLNKAEGTPKNQFALLQFTDIEDFTILGSGLYYLTKGKFKAKSLSGEDAGLLDVGAATIGFFVPYASGSAIKGAGSAFVKSVIKKAENYATHLDKEHVSAAVGDILGKPVKKGGKVYDHQQEVENALRGVGKQIENLNKKISKGDLSGEALEKAKNLRSSLQKQKDKIQDVLNKAKKQAKKQK